MRKGRSLRRTIWNWLLLRIDLHCAPHVISYSFESPSTGILAAVIQRALSEAKNATTSATSSGLPIRFSACIPRVASRPASVFVKFDISFSYGSCPPCGHRQLPEALGNQYHASSRDRPCHHGNIPDSVDTWRRAATRLRTELSPCVCNQPPSEGRVTNCRSGPRLQKVEPVSDPQAFAFEIGRVSRSRLEEASIKLVMHASK
jgi:hypothetical protein